ncbi:MAG: RecQ family ATP-dependent DNA helicase [Thermomicrobiales bacterium]
MVAQEKFGLEKLRPGQGEAIDGVLRGRDTLAVMPTGSGKSAIYQIAGVTIDGYTIVVSPLIALQQDQVESIVDMGAGAAGAAVGAAAEVNSTLTDTERDDVFARLQEGKIEFLFLAPEQFANEDTMACLEKTPPALFVVDEAHCISEWGHDFRPDYLRLGAMIEQLGHPLTLALTATAAPPVRQEIIERLGMRDPAVVVKGFDRPNIRLAVETFEDEESKRDALLERIEASAKPGIVYAATRRDTEELANALAERGISAAAYHAGLVDDFRGVRAERCRFRLVGCFRGPMSIRSSQRGARRTLLPVRLLVRWIAHAERPSG